MRLSSSRSASASAPATQVLRIPAIIVGERLALGFAVTGGALIFLLGVCWDIQWHTLIGRDRTLIPPHIMMLSGITLSGVAALVSVLSETAFVRRFPAFSEHTTQFAGFFNSSLGAYFAGYASLAAALAFPLDSYWHSLYGIDVAIWAPFHIMFLLAMSLTSLAGAYMLASAVWLANDVGAPVMVRCAQVGALVALATVFGTLTILLIDAYRGPLFPPLSGIVCGWALVATKYAAPWRWSASLMALGYLLIAVMVFLFVPPATHALVLSEGLSYLRGGPQSQAVVALTWPIAPLLSALLLDGWFTRALAQPLASRFRQIVLASVCVLPCLFWAPASHPLGQFVREAMEVVSVPGAIALAFGLLGAFLGVAMGRIVGMSIHTAERP